MYNLLECLNVCNSFPDFPLFLDPYSYCLTFLLYAHALFIHQNYPSNLPFTFKIQLNVCSFKEYFSEFPKQ